LRSKKERAKEEEKEKNGERRERNVEFPKQHNSLRSPTSCLCCWYPTRKRERKKVIFKSK
jgi:hypothetical protein